MKNFNNLTSAEKINFLNPVIEMCKEMLLTGVLVKNIELRLKHMDCKEDLLESIINVAKMRAEEVSHYAFK